ncbi:MAG: carboxypeptidase regulatory-like domain-containing protein [Candidatus Rokubacteria bacterium]|nr:carboxypeptidase regulatory-like domain-containing protein [Candidatus Rokubacteria bacterium]
MWNTSLSRLQTIIGLTTGLLTIAGAVYSGVQYLRPVPSLGEVVAIVHDAKSGVPVPDATIEILTPQNALVTTLTSKEPGRARGSLKEGQYRLRVSHPRFGAEVRQIQVVAGQTAEVRVRLAQRAGGSSPLGEAERTINEGVSAVKRLFQ